ncbi:MAG TPA: HD domain-containing protein [Candidatus Binatia bacterium]|nr:HD domain-containing protein [Candidatus Binatia bacterium]
MAKITDIYQKYKITRSLQEHQLRVAAVAKQICDNLTVQVDTDSVVKACLLHDMANILKFDFSFAHLFAPEGVEYWKKVREEVAKKYQSQDEHQVTVMIAKEIGVSDRVLDYIDSVGFRYTLKTLARPDIEPKICDYSDTRVAPTKITSVQERMEEGRIRYLDRPSKWIKPEQYQQLIQACFDMEKQVFASCKIGPEDITDQSSAPVIEQLLAYEI